jgi:hypothetical protein
LQKISSKFTKVVHGSNMLIRLTWAGPFG